MVLTGLEEELPLGGDVSGIASMLLLSLSLHPTDDERECESVDSGTE